jgi:cytidine deaminase
VNESALSRKGRIQTWEQHQDIFRVMSLRAQARGISWREPAFQVGAAALAWGPVVGFQTVWGANYKPHPGTKGPRVCAEEEAMAHAQLKSCSEIIGIVTAAHYQPDDDCGEDMFGTLPPCKFCRQKFADSIRNGGLITPQTILVCQRVEFGDRKVSRVSPPYTVGDLLKKFPVKDVEASVEAGWP